MATATPPAQPALPPFSELFKSDHVVLGSGSYGGVARLEALPGRGEAHVRAVLASYGDANAASGPLPRLVVKQLAVLRSAHNAEQAARERDALAAHRHRGIVRFFGAWDVGSTVLIVLEAAEGVGDGPLYSEREVRGASDGDFWRYIRTRPRLPEAQCRFIAFQLLSAVRFLHSRGVIHRDLKPENMLCFGPAVQTSAGPVPIVKISDFGTARAMPVSRPDEPKTRPSPPSGRTPTVSPHLLSPRSRLTWASCATRRPRAP